MSLARLVWVAGLSACTFHEHPRAQTSAEIERENAAIMARAQQRDLEATREREAAAEQAERLETQRRDEQQRAADAERAKQRAEAAEEFERRQRSREERAAAAEEAERPRLEWLEQNCELRLPPASYVMHCNPVCWRETVQPCPEYACRSKAPDPGWLPASNAEACAAHRQPVRARPTAKRFMPRLLVSAPGIYIGLRPLTCAAPSLAPSGLLLDLGVHPALEHYALTAVIDAIGRSVDLAKWPLPLHALIAVHHPALGVDHRPRRLEAVAAPVRQLDPAAQLHRPLGFLVDALARLHLR